MADHETTDRLRAAIARTARHLNASATGEGLTPTQASVLALIVVRGPLGLTELADLEGVNPTMLSRVVGKLTDLGLIDRRPDPDDNRAVRVRATPAGTRTVKRIRATRSRALAAGLDRLAPDQVAILLAALPALEALSDELPASRREP